MQILTHRKKLEPRSRKLIFVGYATNGYRLWDEEERKIVLSRDVKFVLTQDTKEKESKEETQDWIKRDEPEENNEETEAPPFQSDISDDEEINFDIDSDEDAGEEESDDDQNNDRATGRYGLRQRGNMRISQHLNDYELNLSDISQEASQ